MKRWIHAATETEEKEYRDFIHSVIYQFRLNQYFKEIQIYSQLTAALELKYPYKSGAKENGEFNKYVYMTPNEDSFYMTYPSCYVVPLGDYQAAGNAISDIVERIKKYTAEYKNTAEYKSEEEYRSYTEDKYPEYLEKCKELSEKAQLTQFFKNISVDRYGRVLISLKDPYKAGKGRFGYIDDITLVNHKWSRDNDPAVVERVIPFNSSRDKASLRKLKQLKDNILTYTKEYEESKKQKSANSLINMDGEVEQQIESICYETFDNYPEVSFEDAVDISIEHLINPDIYGLEEGKDFSRANVEDIMSRYY